MFVISIDPATTSGITIFKDNKPVEFFLIKLKKDYRVQLFNCILFLIDKYNPTSICLEDYKVGTFKNAAEKSYGIREIIKLVCELKNVKYKTIMVSNWKNYLLGKYSTKQAKAKYGKDFNKIIIKNKLDELGYILPEKIENLCNNKKYKTTYDVYDSLAIGLYYLNS